MSNFSQAANVEGQVPRLDPGNASILLIESYTRAQAVVTGHEQLDSQRN